MSELVPAVPLTNPDDIAALPLAQRGEVITRALEESKSWLAVATKGTDPTPIAEFKAWAATVAEMTRQKGLAEDIQLDAVEMVRRAERGIGVAIRNGQAAGQLNVHGQHTYAGNQHTTGHLGESQDSSAPLRSSVTTVTGMRYDQLSQDVYPVTDGVTDDDFEEALSEARAEKNLARANVVRKVRGRAGRLTRMQKAAEIREMAVAGYSSRQMSEPLDTGDTTIRKIARDHGIDIPADRVTTRTKHIDPERVVRETVNTLQGIEYGLGLLSQADYDAFTPEQVRAWLGALRTPARAIRVLLRELNERV